MKEIAEYAVAQIAALVFLAGFGWVIVKFHAWRRRRQLRWAQHNR